MPTTPTNTQDALSLLQTSRLFADVPEQALTSLLQQAQPATFKKGEALVHQGDEDFSLLLLLQGVCKVAILDEEGQETLIGLIEAGETVGELSAIDRQPRGATVLAIVPTQALRLSGEAFERLCDQHPILLRRMLVQLSERLRLTNSHSTDLLFQDLRARLIATLARLARVFGQRMMPTPDNPDVTPVLINQKITQVDLGLMANGSREQVNRILAQMIAEGLIKKLDGKLLLLRPELF